MRAKVLQRIALGMTFAGATAGCGNSGVGGSGAGGGGAAGTTQTGGASGSGTGGTASASGGQSGQGGSIGTGGDATGGTSGQTGSGGASGRAGTGGGSGAAGGGSGAAGAGTGGASGHAGTGGGSGAGGAGGAVASDYPYCNYGAVPDATAPVWSDTPTLTPLGINPFGAPALTIPVGYILLNEGPNGTTQVPQATQSSILSRINEDLKFETANSYVHLPPWVTGATASHYMDYMFVATGFPNDPNAGGDQGTEKQYADVETTSVAMTDASQRFDVTHEFNHVLITSYGTFPGNVVSWIHESYNDYLILLTAEHAAGATPGQSAQFPWPSNVGYLDALVYQQAYVPIESCGINAADGSTVNGPADFPTDTTGFRYNDLFPLFLAQRVGQHFFAATLEKGKSGDQILQTMTRLLDAPRVQCLVQEYGARLALGDFREMSTSVQKVASTAMYAATSNSNGLLTPTNTLHLPRYTGRNNVPLTVSSGATQVTVDFMPDAMGSKGTTADMRAQIVYRATDGSAVYGAPAASGPATITLTKAPKNNVVVVVISNVTLSGFKTAKSYGWDPSETFGYKLQVTGAAPAPTNVKYF